jgi:hypothetical protein
LNLIIFSFKFENTLHTLDLDVTQFPIVIENNIQRTCPNEAKFINTNFEKNKKPYNYEIHYKSPKAMHISPKQKLPKINVNCQKHPLQTWKKIVKKNDTHT